MISEVQFIMQNTLQIRNTKMNQLELPLNKPKDATPEEVAEWQNGGDFFMTGNFDVMKLFVVIPAVVQVVMFSFMLGVFYINNLFI
jgi:hypothetical protein